MGWSAACPSVGTDVSPDDCGRGAVAPALVEAVGEFVAAGCRTCLDLMPAGVSSSVDELAPVVPEVCWPRDLRTVAPDSRVVVISDGFDVSDLSAELSDSSVEAAGDEFDSEAVSSAHATPGVVAMAPPMPSATARAPTRPMYLPYTVVTLRLGFDRHAA